MTQKCARFCGSNGFPRFGASGQIRPDPARFVHKFVSCAQSLRRNEAQYVSPDS